MIVVPIPDSTKSPATPSYNRGAGTRFPSDKLSHDTMSITAFAFSQNHWFIGQYPPDDALEQHIIETKKPILYRLLYATYLIILNKLPRRTRTFLQTLTSGTSEITDEEKEVLEKSRADKMSGEKEATVKPIQYRIVARQYHAFRKEIYWSRAFTFFDALWPCVAAILLITTFIWTVLRANFLLFDSELNQNRHHINLLHPFLALLGSMSGVILTSNAAIRKLAAISDEINDEQKNIVSSKNEYHLVIKEYAYPNIKKEIFFSLVELVFEIKKIKNARQVLTDEKRRILNKKISLIKNRIELNRLPNCNEMTLSIDLIRDEETIDSLIERLGKLVKTKIELFQCSVWRDIISSINHFYRSKPELFADNFYMILNGDVDHDEALRQQHNTLIEAIISILGEISSERISQITVGYFEKIEITKKDIYNIQLQKVINSLRESAIYKPFSTEPYKINIDIIIQELINRARRTTHQHHLLFFKPGVTSEIEKIKTMASCLLNRHGIPIPDYLRPQPRIIPPPSASIVPACVGLGSVTSHDAPGEEIYYSPVSSQQLLHLQSEQSRGGHCVGQDESGKDDGSTIVYIGPWQNIRERPEAPDAPLPPPLRPGLAAKQ